MKTQCHSVVVFLLFALLALGGCTDSSPWIKTPPDTKVYTMLEIPLRDLVEHPERHIGTVFEDQFKFYHIYHSREDVEPGPRQQVILGKTHFTARPIKQDTMIIQIQITPQQESWMEEHHVARQDVLRARVRFAGIAPGEALAFELLEITQPPIHMRQK